MGFKIPKAIPATHRPTIIKETPLEAHWKMDPTMVKKVERRRVRRRPRVSRRRPLEREPRALPALPMETMAPIREEMLEVLGENM